MPLTDRQTDFSERRIGNLNKTGQRVEDTTSRSRTNSLSSSLSNTGSTTSGTTRNTNQFNTAPTFRGGEGVLSSLINRFQEGSPTPTGRTGVDYFNKVLGQNAGEGGFIGDLVKNIRDQSDYNLPGELNRARGQFGGRGPGGRTALNIDDAVVKNRLGRDSLTSQLQQNQYNQDRSLQSNIANILANLGARETDQSLGLLNTLKGQSGASANVQDQYSTTNSVTSEQRRTQTEQLVNSLINSIFNEQSNYDQQLQSVKTEEGSLVDEIVGGSDILQIIFEKLIPGIIPDGKKKNDDGDLGPAPERDRDGDGGPTIIPTIFNRNPKDDPVDGGPTITPIINQNPPRENYGGPTVTPIINQNPPRENTGGGPGVTPIINQNPPGETPPPGRVAGPNDRNPWNDFFRPVITGNVNPPTETAPPGTNVGTDPNTFRPIPVTRQNPPAEITPGDVWHPSTPVSIYNNNEATSAKDIETKSNTGGKSNKLVTAAMIAATLATGGVPLIIPTGRNQGPTKAQMANRELDDATEAHEIDGLEQDIRRIQDETADLATKNRIDADARARGLAKAGYSYSQAIEQGAILPSGQIDYEAFQVVDFGDDVTTNVNQPGSTGGPNVASNVASGLSAAGTASSLANVAAAGATSITYPGGLQVIGQSAELANLGIGVAQNGVTFGGQTFQTAQQLSSAVAATGNNALISGVSNGFAKLQNLMKGTGPLFAAHMVYKLGSQHLTFGPQRTITAGGMGGSATDREAALNSVRAKTPKELSTRRQLIEDTITGMEQSGDPPEKIREVRSQNLYILGLIDEVTAERAGPTTPAGQDTRPLPSKATDPEGYNARVRQEKTRRSAERSRKAREAVIRAGPTAPAYTSAVNTQSSIRLTRAQAERDRRANDRLLKQKKAQELARLGKSEFTMADAVANTAARKADRQTQAQIAMSNAQSQNLASNLANAPATTIAPAQTREQIESRQPGYKSRFAMNARERAEADVARVAKNKKILNYRARLIALNKYSNAEVLARTKVYRNRLETGQTV